MLERLARGMQRGKLSSAVVKTVCRTIFLGADIARRLHVGRKAQDGFRMARTSKGTIIGRLQTAARLSRTALAERLLDQGLYAGQDKIMLALDKENGLTPGQLAERLGVRPPTITKTINRLAAQGFLEKRGSQTDARRAHVYLTESGAEVIRAIERSVRKTEKQALKSLDKEQQKTLANLLAHIEANLSRKNPPPLEEEEHEEDV